MGKVISKKPENTRIEVRTCINRGGHQYTHPFIGDYAISRCLEYTLTKEYGIRCTEGEHIPDCFFEKYDLIAVVPDSDDDRKKYVTSDYWLTVGRKSSFILGDHTRLPRHYSHAVGHTIQRIRKV